MIHWAGDRIKALGGSVEYADIGQQTLPDGSKIKYGKSTVSTDLNFFTKYFFSSLPPVLLGNLGNDPKKKTLLLYGHLDVQPAAKEDGWDYEPFVVKYLSQNAVFLMFEKNVNF